VAKVEQSIYRTKTRGGAENGEVKGRLGRGKEEKLESKKKIKNKK
jgi:hypothetical protein